MSNMSKENLKKLAMLKESLAQEGYKIPEEKIAESVNDEKAEKEVIYSEKEEKLLAETCEIWGISRKQAISILETVGSFRALSYTNKIRTVQREKDINYKGLFEQLKKDRAFIVSVASLEEKYFTNYEKKLNLDLKQADLIVLERTNQEIEKTLNERRPLLDRAKLRYDAVGAVIYYGMMVDLQKMTDILHNNDVSIERMSDRDMQKDRILPSMELA